jgi:RNA polymerase sigma-70 factor (ECF subfamily)
VARRGTDTLVSAARAGDQAAWRQLYALHAGRLVLWLRWRPLLDAASSPEDIAAQAWLTAAAKMNDFRGSDDEFAGWLFGIARRHAANTFRRGVRRRTRPSDLEDSQETIHAAGADDISRVEEEDNIRRLLAHLSRREAEVITCVDVVGMDIQSTATALGMRTTAVRVARHRGLGRLRRLFGDPECAREPGTATLTG